MHTQSTFPNTVTPFDDTLHLFVMDGESRQFTARTIIYYRTTLHPFFVWLAGQEVTDLAAVTPAHIRTYLIHLRDRKLASATQFSHAKGLKAFFHFCVREELLPKTPFDKVKMPKVDQKLPSILGDDQIEKLRRGCKTARETALLLTMLDTGLRVAEVTRLNWRDIELETGRVMIFRGKQRKDRVAFAGAQTRKALLKWRIRSPRTTPESPVFVSEHGGTRLTVVGLQQVLRRLGRRVEVRVTPHMLRRSFATRSLRAGMDIYTLAAVMGHASIDTLKHYLRIEEADIRQASAKFGVVDGIG